MKKLTLIFLLVFPVLTKAQFSSDLLIFNPYSEAFKVSINNSYTNNYGTNKFFINNLSPGNYFVEIMFSNYYTPPIRLNIYIESNSLVVCRLLKNIDGSYYADIYTAIFYDNKDLPQNLSNMHSQYPNLSPQHPNTQYRPSVNGFCQTPMEEQAFVAALNTVIKASFESSKEKIAKTIVQSNCLTSLQIKKIINCFSFESTKLSFAKFAYQYVFDPNNYFIVNDAFDFSSSIDELNDFISNY